MNETESVDFNLVLASLQDMSTPFPARYLRSFSDLSRRHRKDLVAIWQALPETRKVNLLEDLEDVMESDTLVSFDTLARELLSDPHASIRIFALRLLWECEDAGLIPDLLKLSTQDADIDARTTATSLLGKYVLLGELDALRPEMKEKVVNHLLAIMQSGDHAQVKRRALESLGYSSHPSVPAMIQNAFLSEDNTWITSALCAMGRSADEAWASQVDGMLTSDIPEVQFEAVRAAGELELSTSRGKMLSLLDAEVEDQELKLALIWSLSQIGGDEVKEKLDELLELAADEDEADWIEKALENLELSAAGGLESFNFDRDQDEDYDLDDEDYVDDEDGLDDFDDELEESNEY
jgi:hypothetical protein